MEIDQLCSGFVPHTFKREKCKNCGKPKQEHDMLPRSMSADVSIGAEDSGPARPKTASSWTAGERLSTSSESLPAHWIKAASMDDFSALTDAVSAASASEAPVIAAEEGPPQPTWGAKPNVKKKVVVIEPDVAALSRPISAASFSASGSLASGSTDNEVSPHPRLVTIDTATSFHSNSGSDNTPHNKSALGWSQALSPQDSVNSGLLQLPNPLDSRNSAAVVFMLPMRCYSEGTMG